MKYVRTKDGIYQSVFFKIGADSKTGEEYLTGKDTKIHALNNKIIKQADTIEELCDYCLYYNCYDDFVIRKVPLSTSLESLYRDMQYKLVKDIKLAIKTDKGIIYVAKMNDKGELELL